MTVTAPQRQGLLESHALVAVQTFNVARLTSHPVAICPGTFVAVTGRGPSDSNESGKTSFLAAVALLLGDPEWLVGSTNADGAASLLFEPDTAGVSAATYPAATTGYIVGVFAALQGDADPYTVWMQINSRAKYLRIRHMPGEHLVSEGSDVANHLAAGRTFQSIPASSELGAKTYAEFLYGPSPRCLAYVAARGKKRSGPSLLKMDSGAFTPAQIGDALVKLTGRAEALQTEQDQRVRLSDAAQQLEDAIAENDRLLRMEADQLAAVATRKRVRELVAIGRDVWHRHLARGLIDVAAGRTHYQELHAHAVAESEHLGAAVAELEGKRDRLGDPSEVEQRVQQADAAAADAGQEWQDAIQKRAMITAKRDAVVDRRTKLEAAGARDCRVGVDQANALHREATATFTAAQVNRQRCAETATSTVAALRSAEQGLSIDTRATLVALREAGIDAAGLTDQLQLDAAQRDMWEARIYPYRHAVAAPFGTEAQATRIAAAIPGAMIVCSPEAPLPSGVTQCPPGAAGFLAELADRMPAAGSATVKDPRLSAAFIGAFSSPITGRQALIAAASADNDAAHAHLVDAEQQERTAVQALELAAMTLAQAQAAEEYVTAGQELDTIETVYLPAADTTVNEAVAALDKTTAEAVQTQAAHASLAAAIDAVTSTIEDKRADLKHSESQCAAHKAAYERQDVDGWERRFGGTAAEAATFLQWPDETPKFDPDRGEATPPLSDTADSRTRETIRRRSGEQVAEILTLLTIDPATGDGAPNTQITEAVYRRAHRRDDQGEPITWDAAEFPLLADAISDWLSEFDDSDAVAEQRILHVQAERANEIAHSTDSVTQLTQSLSNIQGALEARIEDRLKEISSALNILNKEADGFGAQIAWTSHRPEGPQDQWVWDITPAWKRSPNGRMLRYDNVTNSAQEKMFSVHLVLAALLASPNPAGRVLILDELGDMLGLEHRREILSAVRAVADRHQITILGTCQDSMLEDAAEHSGQILWFRYRSKNDALNEPTRMFGFDENKQRVELTARALQDARSWP